MAKIKEKKIGYIVTVNEHPTGLALYEGLDIVKEKRSSLKGTRLYFDTKATLFPTRRKARRAIKRTMRAVAVTPGFNIWKDGAEFYIVPVTVLK